MAVLCKGRNLRCENEAKIRGYCKSCMRYMQRYPREEYEQGNGIVVIGDIQHKIGSHGLIYRKAATGGWVRSTKTLAEFTAAQAGPKKRKSPITKNTI